MWEWAASTAECAGFERLVLVTRGDARSRAGWVTVCNDQPEEGLAGSIRIGVTAAQNADRIVIALADMPFVPKEHLVALAQGDGVIFTAYPDGRRGIPAAFPPSAFDTLLSLSGDKGAAALGFEQAVVIEAQGAGALLDVDTPADLERAQELAGALDA